MSAQPDRSLLGKLHSIEQAQEAPNTDNHPRLFRRYVVRGDALLHPMNRSRLDATPLDIKLRDLSRGGAGFICNQPLALHSTWRLEVLIGGYAVGAQALIVRHVEEVSAGMYLIGTTFVLDTAIMALLGVEPTLLEDAEDITGPRLHQDDDDDFVTPAEVA